MKNTILSILILLLFANNINLFAQNNLKKAKELAKNKNYEKAKKILEEIVDKDETNAEAFFILGQMNMALRDFEEASDNFEDAVELDKGNSNYHFWLGRAYGADAQQSSIITKAMLAPKIKKQFEIAVALDSNNIGAKVGLAHFYLRAPGIMGGSIDKAMEQGKILLQLDEPNGRIILAQVYQAKDKPELADEQYELLLTKYGNDKKFANIYNAYGYRLLKQGKTEEAIAAFKKQIELAPERANSYDSLGDGYKKAGKIKLAIEQYKKALEIDPTLEASKKKLKKIENEN